MLSSIALTKAQLFDEFFYFDSALELLDHSII